jgi:D-aminopeptidase
VSAMRARDLPGGIGTGTPGRRDAITDVAGVRVGHCTIIEGDGPLRVGHGPVRTGVTVIEPSPSIWREPLFAAPHRLNGNGELTGLEWMRESGLLTTPIALTNTHSVGVVRDALVAHGLGTRGPDDDLFWALPVVGETWDGLLNDVNGLHVTPAHVEAAFDGLSDGPVAEGGVGGGTGMVCHDFKGGIGTASRVVGAEHGGFMVGVLVQANHGRRARLAVNGVSVGRMIGVDLVPEPRFPDHRRPGGAGPDLSGTGSIIVVVATDAPLLPHQCARLAQRAGLGIARTGGVGEHTSGDIFLCFATGNRGLSAGEIGRSAQVTLPLAMLADDHITPLFDATVEATEAAIVNALLGAETMTGADGVTAHALPAERLAELLR